MPTKAQWNLSVRLSGLLHCEPRARLGSHMFPQCHIGVSVSAPSWSPPSPPLRFRPFRLGYVYESPRLRVITGTEDDLIDVSCRYPHLLSASDPDLDKYARGAYRSWYCTGTGSAVGGRDGAGQAGRVAQEFLIEGLRDFEFGIAYEVRLGRRARSASEPARCALRVGVGTWRERESGCVRLAAHCGLLASPSLLSWAARDMSSALSGIKFVSKEEIEEQRRRAKEAAAARDQKTRDDAKERRQETRRRQETGEGSWVAPAVERRLGGDERKRSKHDKHKHHKHDKHKRSRRHEERSGSESDDATAPPAAPGGAVPERAAAADGAAATTLAHPEPAAAGRSRGPGLDWMSAPLASGPAAAAGGAASGSAGGAPAEDLFAACASMATSRTERRQQSEAAAAAAAPPAEPSARVVRELNPYAREGVDIDQWSA